MDDPLLRDAMTVSARPDVIRFATGIPSPELYPIDAIRDIFNEALANAGQTLLQHTPTEGFPPLREQLSAWMGRAATAAGVPAAVEPSQVVVVAGSQQGLYLLARTLIEPGDLVVVESPTYLGAAQVFRAAGARLLPIPIDQDGMQVDLLQEMLPRRRPKLIYTLPTFQNPSGSVLAMGRRLRLLDLAARYQVPVIEDDPYGALRYEGRPLPTLAAIDHAEGRGNVIYLTTVSKMLFPGFRIGWVAAPKPVVERVTLMKQLVDLDTNALAQRAVCAFFERGLLDAHLERINRIYPRRRDRMLQALQRECGALIAANRPSGGIYLWCRLNEGMRVRDLLPEAAREGVIFAPGESFHVDASSGRGRFDIRLNFTLPTDGEIDEGVRRLGVAVQRLADHLDVAGRGALVSQPLTPIV
jgi:DNA-binding transcriptional MocR family regulator